MVTADEIADRALTFGASALTATELLATLLHRGEPGDLALAKARGLLEAIGGVLGLLTCDSAIARAQQLDPQQSAALLAAVELGRRLAYSAVTSEPLPRQEAVARYIQLVFGRPNQIVFGAIFMDLHHRAVGHLDAFRGTHESVVVDPRPILRAALRHNAHGLLVFRVSPNGDPTISESDVTWAERMRKACKLVDLEFNDYLVFAGERWSSIRRFKPG